MPRPASDIRERLIEAARGRFLHEGVDGASLRSVAHDAKTSIGMVYYYFKTKDDLFFGVVEQAYAKLVAEWARDLSADTSLEDKLHAIYQRMARLDDAEIDVLRLIIREALVSSSRLTRLVQRFEQGHVPLVLRMIRGGLESGELDPSRHMAVLLSATASMAVIPQIVHRLISTTALPIAQLLPTRQETANQLVGVLLHGIAKPEPPR